VPKNPQLGASQRMPPKDFCLSPSNEGCSSLMQPHPVDQPRSSENVGDYGVLIYMCVVAFLVTMVNLAVWLF
jgi:hypothetical protein